ncbi:hypothetical protein PTKIN_Ptkin06aG0026900 [Pterospermum kingtungense]
MVSFKCLSSLAIIFLATSTFSFNGCHADKALIDSVCRQSQDYSFCATNLGGDPRAATTDLHGLALVSISLTVAQIQDTLGRIPDIQRRVTNPLGKKRLGVCQNDYKASLGNFQNSFRSTSKNAYGDTINFVRDGTNQVIHCHNIYRMNGPIATSPIAGDDTKVIKYSEIILIIVDRLIPKK